MAKSAAFAGVPLLWRRLVVGSGAFARCSSGGWRSVSARPLSSRRARGQFPRRTPATASAEADGVSEMFDTNVQFGELGLSEEVVLRVGKCGFKMPTKAQAKAIPELLAGQKDVMLAAETGSGKTFAYLLPVLDEYLGKSPSDRNGVRALVLVPTQELSAQLLRFARMLDSGIGVSSLGGDKFSVSRNATIISATPQAFIDRAEMHDFADLRWIIIDEADLLLTSSFKEQVIEVLRKLRKPMSMRQKRALYQEGLPIPDSNPRDGEPQIVFMGATYPEWIGTKVKSVGRTIKRMYPDSVFLETDLIHRANPLLEERWVDLGSQDPMPLVADAIQSGPKGQAIVFCNTVRNVQDVTRYLQTVPGMTTKICSCHRGVHISERLETLERFRKGESRVMVCTDVAARGIDLGDNITHIIQYEFGPNVTNYLHRIGRTARAGNKGLATHFVPETGNELATGIRNSGRGRLEKLFSRNRSLRNKRRKALRKANPEIDAERKANREVWNKFRIPREEEQDIGDWPDSTGGDGRVRLPEVDGDFI